MYLAPQPDDKNLRNQKPAPLLTLMRTALDLQDPNPSPGAFRDNPGSVHKNSFLIYGTVSTSHSIHNNIFDFLLMVKNYQKQN
jgi:hypothetical protein